MKTITISDQLLNELFPDFTKQLVRAWTRGHVDGLTAEVVDAIDSQPAYPTAASAKGPSRPDPGSRPLARR
jgi:hypothetical protein